MADPNTSWPEITTTTLNYRTPKMFDLVSEHNAIVNRLKGKGKIKLIDGGEAIVIPLEYAENSTYMSYSGYEHLNISPSTVFSAAEYAWKQIAIAVSISGLEQIQNSGKAKKFDLLKSRIANAERTFVNSFATDLYSDGTGTSGKQIGGLQLLVEDTSQTSQTSAVGGITRDSTDTPWWQTRTSDATTDYGAALSSSNVQSYMNRKWLDIVRGTDKPDLILCDNNYYRAYWESLQAIQRIERTDMAEAGFEALKYKSADVVFDGGYGGQCPTNHMYFLNTDYLYLVAHKDRNMAQLSPDRVAVNQDALVKLVAFAGNLCLANAFVQGLIKD